MRSKKSFISYTIALSPIETESEEKVISEKLLGKCYKNIGFITKVDSIEIQNIEISNYTGKHIYDVKVHIHTFLPGDGDVLIGIVEKKFDQGVIITRASGYLIVMIRISSDLDANIYIGKEIQFSIKSIRYQKGLYKALGDYIPPHSD